MDHSLAANSENCCETYVCNYSDKTVHLLTNCKFCKGIVVTNSLITIGEQSFTTSADVDIEMIAREVNKTEFPEHKEQLLNIFHKFREAIALKGDKLR